MLRAAVAVMALGTVGVSAAVGLEIWLREPIYLVLMKVFPSCDQVVHVHLVDPVEQVGDLEPRDRTPASGQQARAIKLAILA